MSDLALFENMPAEYKDLLAQLEPDTNATGGKKQGGTNRLSIRGGVFRKVVNGQEIGELAERAINLVIVKTAPISRMYYAAQYTAGANSPPSCWSANSGEGRPHEDVPKDTLQGSTCFDCPQNIKGSGQGQSRACRYQQRVAVMLTDVEGDLKSSTVYQMSLPATSIFGDDKKKMGLQTYARLIDSQNAPLASIITELRFDTDSSTPKLCFKPVRVLEKSELELAIVAQKDESTLKLVTLTVKPKEETSVPQPSDAKVSSPAVKANELLADVDDDDEVEEPKVKVSRKKKNAPKPEVDLASLLEQFDD
jgi:hypothetical protein|tara:strand:+ start:678 stop:1601 length:924 start_codon:yes stop_codon:yes gene_type:complete